MLLSLNSMLLDSERATTNLNGNGGVKLQG
ncbi:hypothetical protein BA6E_10311 [Bacteroidales bacterium 6E]|nr:hypothetical protein BA6E_10311 [Bacteroidales bacterium 6E]